MITWNTRRNLAATPQELWWFRSLLEAEMIVVVATQHNHGEAGRAKTAGKQHNCYC